MKHFIPIFRALEEVGVSYITVGGIAAVVHGVPRMTGDIDLVLDLEEQNCIKALDALGKLGFVPRAPVEITDFANSSIRDSWIRDKGMVVFSLTSPNFPIVMVDIFTEYPLPFDQLYSGSAEIEIEECKIRIASIDDIILMKRSAGREKDLEDVRILEHVRDNK